MQTSIIQYFNATQINLIQKILFKSYVFYNIENKSQSTISSHFPCIFFDFLFQSSDLFNFTFLRFQLESIRTELLSWIVKICPCRYHPNEKRKHPFTSICIIGFLSTNIFKIVELKPFNPIKPTSWNIFFIFPRRAVLTIKLYKFPHVFFINFLHH